MIDKRFRNARLSGLALALGALGACHRPVPAGPDPRAGATLITRYACGSCHTIPGIEQGDGMVGPSLAQFGRQKMIAGAAPNTPDNLARFVRTPGAFVKDGAMPDQDLTDAQAHAIAAYLLTLK